MTCPFSVARCKGVTSCAVRALRSARSRSKESTALRFPMAQAKCKAENPVEVLASWEATTIARCSWLFPEKCAHESLTVIDMVFSCYGGHISVRRQIWEPFAALKVLDLPCSLRGSHGIVTGRALLRESNFTGVPCSFLEVCPFLWQAWVFRGHFEVWNLSFAWQAWYFLHVATALASAGRNERWFGFFAVLFFELAVHCDLAHGDHSAWQVRYFGCLEFVFRGTFHTSKTSRKSG